MGNAKCQMSNDATKLSLIIFVFFVVNSPVWCSLALYYPFSNLTIS